MLDDHRLASANVLQHRMRQPLERLLPMRAGVHKIGADVNRGHGYRHHPCQAQQCTDEYILRFFARIRGAAVAVGRNVAKAQDRLDTTMIYSPKVKHPEGRVPL